VHYEIGTALEDVVGRASRFIAATTNPRDRQPSTRAPLSCRVPLRLRAMSTSARRIASNHGCDVRAKAVLFETGVLRAEEDPSRRGALNGGLLSRPRAELQGTGARSTAGLRTGPGNSLGLAGRAQRRVARRPKGLTIAFTWSRLICRA
jgi:hypothetical protein